MTAKNLRTALLSEFVPAVESHGFSRGPGRFITFVRNLGSERRQIVEVQNESYLNRFVVTLQEFASAGNRLALLEDFAGRPGYEYGAGTASRVQTAARFAASDFAEFGVPWLEGIDVITPAIQKEREAAAQSTYDLHIRAAREAFKRGDFDSALFEFSSATEIKELDPVSEKFREIATKRRLGG